MPSGTLSLGRSKQTEGQLLWTATSNGTSANTSTVTATLQVRRWDGNYTTTGTWRGTVTIGGISESYSFYSAVNNSWKTVKTLTVTVNHNNDGSGTCYIYGSINGPTQTTQEGATISGSTTVTLDTIARQATMKAVQPFDDGSTSPVITYSNPLGGAAPSLQAGVSLTQSSSGVLTYYDVDKTAGTATLSLSASDLNALRSSITTAKSRTVWIYLRTRVDSTYYYSPLSTTFTVVSAKPTISPTITDTNSVTTALTGNNKKLIRYYSNAAVTIGASALNGASITSRAVTCGGKKLTADGTISGVEVDKFTFTATDSRGLTTTRTITSADGLYSFVNYVKLTCDLANNTPSTDGTMTVKATGNYFNGSFGYKSNSLNVYYRYKVAGTAWPSNGGWNAMTVSKSGNTYTATKTLTGLDYQTNYVFQTYAKDALATVYSEEKNAKSTPVFDWGESDFNFNVPVYIKNNALVSGDFYAGTFQLHEKTITVGGDSNTYYPVYVHSSTASATPQCLFLKKNLGTASGSWSGNHSSGTSSISMGWMYRANGWDGNGVYASTLFKSQPYAPLIAAAFPITGSPAQGMVLYLRGGGATYQLASNIPFTPYVYLTSTNLSGNDEYPWTVAPTTTISNGGIVFSSIPINLDAIYPVNSIYIGYSHTSPAELFGGTWHRIESRFLWGTPSTGTIGATAGEMTHTLTVNELPSHRHSATGRSGTGSSTTGNILETYANYSATRVAYTDYTGGGAAHNNMPPYVNVAIWRRTA